MDIKDYERAHNIVKYFMKHTSYSKEAIIKVIESECYYYGDPILPECVVLVKLILNNVDYDEIKEMSYEECMTWVHLFGE